MAPFPEIEEAFVSRVRVSPAGRIRTWVFEDNRFLLTGGGGCAHNQLQHKLHILFSPASIGGVKDINAFHTYYCEIIRLWAVTDMAPSELSTTGRLYCTYNAVASGMQHHRWETTVEIFIKQIFIEIILRYTPHQTRPRRASRPRTRASHRGDVREN